MKALGMRDGSCAVQESALRKDLAHEKHVKKKRKKDLLKKKIKKPTDRNVAARSHHYQKLQKKIVFIYARNSAIHPSIHPSMHLSIYLSRQGAIYSRGGCAFLSTIRGLSSAGLSADQARLDLRICGSTVALDRRIRKSANGLKHMEGQAAFYSLGGVGVPLAAVGVRIRFSI